MANVPGIFIATKKDGTEYYRASVTYRGKHISLGSYSSAALGTAAYEAALAILGLRKHPVLHMASLLSYNEQLSPLPFEKWVTLINFRDNGIYCRTPIYLEHRFFYYYLDETTSVKFDTDDLFFYMNHKIMRRGNHLFVADYGMQLSILSRYGIRPHAVPGRDYRFVNGDSLDFRYGNIEIINRYHGVTRRLHHGKDIYTAKIHINGDFIIGRYASECEAAIAYNKTADLLKEKGFPKNYPENYIDSIDDKEYARLYANVRITRKLREFIEGM